MIFSNFTVFFKYYYTIKHSFYLKLTLKLEIDPKTSTFKKLEKFFQKPVATLTSQNFT